VHRCGNIVNITENKDDIVHEVRSKLVQRTVQLVAARKCSFHIAPFDLYTAGSSQSEAIF